MTSLHARRRPHAADLAALAVLVTAAGAATAVPARADGGLGTGPFGLKPSTTSAGRKRPYFDLTVAPGTATRDTVIISNPGRRTERLRLTVSRGVTAANSGSAYESVPGPCSGAGCWVTGLPATVTLAPHERRALTFRVRVPAGVQDGQYLTGITAEAAVRPGAVRLGSNGAASAKAIIVRQVTVGVAVTVGALARMKTTLVIPTVSAGWIGTEPRLYIPVRNVGQTFAEARGTASCRARDRNHTYHVVMHTVLPGTDAVLPINAPGLSSGSLPCTVRLRDGAGPPVVWSGLVQLRSPPRQKIIHTGNGAYTALPEQSVPFWAILLMALGTLILAALLALIVLNRRQRRGTIRPTGEGG